MKKRRPRPFSALCGSHPKPPQARLDQTYIKTIIFLYDKKKKRYDMSTYHDVLRRYISYENFQSSIKYNMKILRGNH